MCVILPVYHLPKQKIINLGQTKGKILEDFAWAE
jgi:hypothetical protein